jgi:hypothetical protein
VRVAVFIVIIVVRMNMWRHFATGKRKLRRLRLTVLQRALVALVLKDLRVLVVVYENDLV